MTAPVSAGVDVTDVKQTILDIVHAELQRDVDPSDDVFDHGATSIAFIRIVANINDEFGIAVDMAELEEASADSLSELVARQINEIER